MSNQIAENRNIYSSLAFMVFSHPVTFSFLKDFEIYNLCHHFNTMEVNGNACALKNSVSRFLCRNNVVFVVVSSV